MSVSAVGVKPALQLGSVNTTIESNVNKISGLFKQIKESEEQLQNASLPEPQADVSQKRYHGSRVMKSKLNDLKSNRVLSPLKINTPRAYSSIKTIDMSKISARHPNSIRQGFPDPPESRFESLKGNIELISKFKNSKGTLDFDSASKRGEVWGKPRP